jgi:hypothetical protein
MSATRLPSAAIPVMGARVLSLVGPETRGEAAASASKNIASAAATTKPGILRIIEAASARRTSA